MADLKDFGTVRSWYEAYKEVLGEAEEKKKEDEKKPKVEVLPKEDGEEQEEEKKPEEKSEGGEVEKLKAEIERLKGEVQKKDLEVKKKDAETSVEPNKDTGEIPLRVGIAQSILDKKKKSEKKEVKEMAKDKAYAIGMDAAKKKYNDEPPLDKKTITKGHEIAKKLLKKESLDESTVSVYDVSYDDMPKNKLAQSAKQFRIRMKNLPRNKVQFGGDAAIEFSGSDSDLLKFFKQHFGSTAKNIRDLKKELGEEKLDEATAIEYARKLASYAVKRGGIDKRDFMKIADKLSNAKNDNDLKTIGKQVDSLDTEPRDLIKGSIALQMGPKTYKTMFGDRLTARDMNVYKDMTPRSMKEETLDEGDAYDNDRFLVRGNTATVDNKNTPDTRNHVYAPNAKTAVAMFKKGVKKFLDTTAMRNQFPTYKESLDEVNVNAIGTITTSQMSRLKKSYDSLPDRISPDKGMELSKMLDRFGEGELRQLVHANIKFISPLAVNKLLMKHKYKAKDIHDIKVKIK